MNHKVAYECGKPKMANVCVTKTGTERSIRQSMMKTVER